MTHQFQWGKDVIPATFEGPDDPFAGFPASERHQSVGERFEKMVGRFGERAVVITPEQTVTYSELNDQANRVAHALLDATAGGNEPVALLLGTDMKMMAAVYGALKAGKPYLPLDPTYPRARLAFMLADSGAGILLTDGRHSQLAQGLADDSVAVIDIGQIRSEGRAGNPGVAVSPDAPLWIIYTSGSTGSPKGVTQSHRVALHHTRNSINTMHVSAGDRITLLESFAFSGSVLSYLGAPLSGACMCMWDVRTRGFPGLADWLEATNVTIWSSVPAIFRHFASTLEPTRKLSTLRIVKMGGDRVTADDVKLFRRVCRPGAFLANGYGSTEGGFNTQCFVESVAALSGFNVPVGYAVDGMEILILDEDNSRLPAGRMGQIAVRSRYMADGYWGNAELTAERFPADPEGSGKRIYLTGDMGVVLANGCVVHLGRKDFQLKVRGFRVEAGEVEAALTEIPGVREAAVAVVDRDSGRERLAAYIVPERHPGPTASQLRSRLTEKLPGYMVPTAWVFLDSLPLSANGKLDRTALPEPPSTRPRLDAPYAAPATPVEEELAPIWAETLGIDGVGVGADDSFLDLGGHSLLATRIISRVIETFRVNVGLEMLLASATIRKMALVITEALARRAAPGQVERLLEKIERRAGKFDAAADVQEGELLQ